MADHALIADAERRNLPDVLAHGNLVRTLMATLRLSPGEASRRVRAQAAVGNRHSMTGQPLAPLRPELAAAQRTGDVSPEQVAIIERALARVDHRGFDPADLAEGERLLTRFAETFGPQDLKSLADQVVDHIDPDGSRPAEELNTARRHFHLRPTTDGGWAGEFRLTGAAGAKLSALLGPLATPRIEPELHDNPAVPVDTRTHGQRLHDALEDVCDRLLRGSNDPDTRIPDAGGTPATVIITVDLQDLLAKTGYATASDGTLIRTDQALRLADQADIYFAAVTAKGVPLHLGRMRRIATLGQTIALIARDKGCSFPGCDVPPEWCERHHIRAWLDGGETNLDNLTLLCRYHHHNFAARGWTCRINPDGHPGMDAAPDRRPAPTTHDQHPDHRRPAPPALPHADVS